MRPQSEYIITKSEVHAYATAIVLHEGYAYFRRAACSLPYQRAAAHFVLGAFFRQPASFCHGRVKPAT